MSGLLACFGGVGWVRERVSRGGGYELKDIDELGLYNKDVIPLPFSGIIYLIVIKKFLEQVGSSGYIFSVNSSYDFLQVV